MFGHRLRHKLIDQSDRTVEVHASDGQVYQDFGYLSKPCWIARRSRFGAKLDVSIKSRCDKFTIRHGELEEHTENIVSFTDEYTL